MDIQKIVQLQTQFTQKIMTQAYQEYTISSESSSFGNWDSFREAIKMEEEQYPNEESTQSSLYLDNFDVKDNAFYDDLNSRLEKLNISLIPLVDMNTRFSRQKENQKMIYEKRMEQLSQFISKTIEIPAEFKLELNNLILTKNDLETLQPQRYLNGQCIFFYLKIVTEHFINEDLKKDVFLFNTYFMTKLLGEYITDGNKFMSMRQNVSKDFVRQVQLNASKLLRWVKNTNIFEKKILIFPINLPNHWSAVIVYDLPNLIKNKHKAQILYMDSHGRKPALISQSIRIFLQLQLQTKKNLLNTQITQITKQNLSEYQLLVPRQINFYDCGPCTLLNIQSILFNSNILNADFSKPQSRMSLIKLFPKSLIFTMRTRILHLFLELYREKNSTQFREACFTQYIDKRQYLINQIDHNDYDYIDQKQFKKFLAIQRYRHMNQQLQYAALIDFYINTNTNFYYYQKK